MKKNCNLADNKKDCNNCKGFTVPLIGILLISLFCTPEQQHIMDNETHNFAFDNATK